MFKAQYLISTFKQVPSRWIFDHYLDIGTQLQGQTLRFHTPFAAGGSRTNMRLYYSATTNDYRFKCYYTGISGDGLEMMRHLWNCSHAQAAKRIEEDYGTWLREHGALEQRQVIEGDIQQAYKWRVTAHKTRGWNQDDADYWGAYNISSTLLERFEVKALSEFTMTRTAPPKADEPAKRQAFTVENQPRMYGYFSRGKLCKIYQPDKTTGKFIMVAEFGEYTQGLDQLKGSKALAICASLKDSMAFQSFGFGMDTLAPDSENTALPEWVLQTILPRYKYIVAILDPDQTGITNMLALYEQYNIPYLIEERAKDIADGTKAFTAAVFKQEIFVRLRNIFSKPVCLRL